MNSIDPNKYINIINKSNKNDNENVIRKYLGGLLFKFLFVGVILFSLAIIYKSNSNLKDNISNYFFEDGISFVKIKNFYDKYLGGILPIKKDETITEVFDEKLQFNDMSIYYDGVQLSVSENYLVPVLDEGMVVFIGDKDNYGKTVIIENLNGVQYWYGNISNTSLKLYDYVQNGDLVGEVNGELYMVFSREGSYLNYEEYIY